MYIYTFFAVFLFRLCAWCPLCTQIGYFKHVLLCECAVIPPLRLKSFCVRTQIAKTAHLPAEYIPPTFLTRYPLPLLRRLTVGAAIEKNFFWFLFFWLRFRILFFQNPNFNSLSFARHSSFDFSLCIISYWFSLWILIFLFTIFDSDYNFDSVFFASEFYSHQFRLVSALSILCFDSSTLYLFNSSACYKQTSMLIWVWFMLILAILRLSDVFSFVLGVGYRLGIK